MRGERLQKLIDELDATGLEYDLLSCEPDLADTRIYVQHYDYELSDCANTIVVKSKTGDRNYAACVLLADCRLDVNHTVRQRLGARRVSFAGAEETAQLTAMTIGGVTPIGLPDHIPLWVDSAVMERNYIILGGGSRSWKIGISPKIFELTPNTEIIAGLANPIDPAV